MSCFVGVVAVIVYSWVAGRLLLILRDDVFPNTALNGIGLIGPLYLDVLMK